VVDIHLVAHKNTSLKTHSLSTEDKKRNGKNV